MAQKKDKMLVRQGSVSENFFAVNHASLILPKKGLLNEPVKNMKGLKFGGDLKKHLYGIIRIVRPQDQIKLVARLESWVETHIRYLVIVSTIGRQDTEESVILGIDFEDAQQDVCTIGLAVPILNDVTVQLDGDGGFNLNVPAKDYLYVFKPVSVQAMWSALHALHHCIDTAQYHNYFNGSLFLTWTCYYESRVQSSRLFVNEWGHDEMVWDRRPNYYFIKDKEREATELKIRGQLKEVLMKLDLDNTTSRDVRQALEKVTDLDLKEFKAFIDSEMLVLLSQMESASKILDFLYLGSAWNAADSEALEELGITHILNITLEIDNYFPDDFMYKNVRLYDELDSDLLPWWNDTYKFIKRAVRSGGKCLVHCKMGISRSSATVTAFLMKEMRWPLEQALNYVREKRPMIAPNPSFLEQLHEYEGILNASNQRHNALFRSLSESNLTGEQVGGKKDDKKSTQSSITSDNSVDLHRRLLDITAASRRHSLKRSKSWTAGESKLEDDEILRQELYGDEVTEPFSEPQNLNMKSSELDTPSELEFRKPESKKKRKFKRRHTDMVLAWQSSDTDMGLRSNESMVANSDCGVPTHRFSWGQLSGTSSEEYPDLAGFGRSNGTTKDSSRPRKSSLSQKNETIDEVFEAEENTGEQTETMKRQSSVRNLVNSIESKCSTKTHSRQGSSEKGRISPQNSTPPQIPVVPDVSIVENQNSNNNSSQVLKPSAIVSDAKVIILPLQENNADEKTKEYRTLTEQQLQIIRQVGMTFLGEISPTSTSLLAEGNTVTETKGSDSGKVRKGLVKKMARDIENHMKQSLQHERLQAADGLSADNYDQDTNDKNTQSSGSDVSKSSHLQTKSVSSSFITEQGDATSQSQLPHIFSFVAPTPYHQFQKSFKTGKSIKKSMSFNTRRFRRGVARSLSERSHASRMQAFSKEESTIPYMENSHGNELILHQNNVKPSKSPANDNKGNVALLQEGGGNVVTEFPLKKNLNRIDRQNSFYKSI